MERLIEGYRRFRAKAWREHRDLFEALASRGQSPRALVIACSDSRIDPQMIFSAAPGELFVIRNVANLVPPYAPDADYHGTSAAIEFAVRALAVRDVIVLGHADCGGVRALLDGSPAPVGDFVDPWMAIAASARTRAQEAAEADRQRICEHETVKISLANLMTFPWLRERAESGALALHGCWFDLGSGDLLRLDSAGVFRPVERAPSGR